MAKSANDRRIDYIELNVTDIERSKAFYGDAFGWSFKDYGPNYCEFGDGRLTGGFTTNAPPTPGGPLVILYADDLIAMQSRVEAAGGRIANLSSISLEGSVSTSWIPTATSSPCGRSADRGAEAPRYGIAIARTR